MQFLRVSKAHKVLMCDVCIRITNTSIYSLTEEVYEVRHSIELLLGTTKYYG